jgi:hypothetical protein
MTLSWYYDIVSFMYRKLEDCVYLQLTMKEYSLGMLTGFVQKRFRFALQVGCLYILLLLKGIHTRSFKIENPLIVLDICWIILGTLIFVL